MKFRYCYRTRDNVEHWADIRASSREAVFSVLKAKGIRPGRVIEAPGFFNFFFGKGKRWAAIVLLAVGLLVSLIWGVRARQDVVSMEETLDVATRRQLIGDAAVIEMGIKTGWSNVFQYEGEQFLASFAVPGMIVGKKNTSESEIRQALSRKVGIDRDDGIEVRQIKAMVEGMKGELRAFLKNGGTIVEYGERLVQRQEQEIQYYNRAKAEIDAAFASGMEPGRLVALWEERNNSLRRMGIRLVSLPE